MAVDLLLGRLQTAIADRYTLVRELGRGGMATVYLAQDIRNSRQVAVKVLSPELASAIGTGRFTREIEIAARLVHPHIVPLFESGDAAGLLYYVMPLIEGESLRSRLAREGALPVEDAVGIAREVGSALNFAHEHGFVHRDIKPENILLQAGQAYVADFGVALALQGLDQERLTNTGLSLGTPAYMSPEQASGDRRVDQRSDIYSLGSVVYEMLAGEPPFSGSVRAVIARVMTEQPLRLSAIRPTIPGELSEVVGRAMAKMPADRYRSAEEFVQALHRAQSTRVRFQGARSWLPRRWRQYALVAAAGVGVVFVGSGYLETRSTSVELGPRTDRQLTYSGDVSHASISPDGRKAAYVTGGRTLMVRDLETGDSSVLARDSLFLGGGANPVWTRDGSRLLYAASHPTGGAYYLISATGGKPETIALSNANLVFGPDDTTYLATLEAAVYIGRAPTTFQILSGDSIVGDGTLIDLRREFAFIWRSLSSPDGRWIASLGHRANGEVVLFTLARDGRHAVLIPDLGAPSSPLDDWARPLAWSGDSRTIYFPRPQGLGWSVWSIDIDPQTGAASGSPRLVAERLPSALEFGVSADGRRLLYSGGPVDVQLSRFRLTSRGKVESTLTLTTGSALHKGPGLSPDGSQIAYIRQEQDGKSDLFLVSIDGGLERRLTSTGLRKGSAAWSPNGRSIAFVELRKPQAVLVVVDIATGQMSQVGRGPGEVIGNEFPPVWSPDGRTLLYQAVGSRNYFVVDRTTGEQRRLIPVADESVGWLFNPVFPPGGGRHVVARWSRHPKTYLWDFGLDDGSRRQLPGEAPPGVPMLWGRDSLIYHDGWTDSAVSGSKGTPIYRSDPTSGRVSTIARLPLQCLWGHVTISGDARTVVCATARHSSDVWLSEVAHSR
jgi:serine/threonine-protein kinase